ncbi:winged helix-turn-helix domain-containing protein [Haloglycomyces albus]|uniref:winged helix-turn-helix domain-containing protein n=1 Tax=Haloglycomyces albus TaxID=526067 RepID=UPI00146FB632|nr:GntR family transcriptional regulator [Haloglycomyces albus]
MDQIVHRIDNGQYPIGEFIPSTTQLIKESGASKTVVINAVRELKAKGYLDSHPAKGVFVVATTDEITEDDLDMGVLTRDIAEVRERVDRLGSEEHSLDDLRAEISGLRRMVYSLHAHLIELYGKVGQPYPEGLLNLSEQDTNRRAS